MRIGLVSALIAFGYFLLIAWAVHLCELEFNRLFCAYIEFPPYQPLLPSPGPANRSCGQ